MGFNSQKKKGGQSRYVTIDTHYTLLVSQAKQIG